MKKLIFGVLIIINFSAYAQKSEKPYNNSELNRQNKDMSIAVQVFGHGPAPLITHGLHLGFFIDPNSLITAEIVYGNNPLIWGSGKYEIKTLSLSSHYKLFVGNSFYLKLGLDYRRIDYNYEDSLFGSSYEQTSFVGNSVAAAFMIGNQWQWETTTFGFDWVGISAPFITNIESSSVKGSAPNTSRRDRDETNYLKDNVLILLRGYVGVSF